MIMDTTDSLRCKHWVLLLVQDKQRCVVDVVGLIRGGSVVEDHSYLTGSIFWGSFFT